MDRRSLFIILIFLVAVVMRFYDLGERPLWIDEAKYAETIDHYKDVGFFKGVYETRGRELLLSVMGYVFGLESDFALRFPVALFSSLAILALLVLPKNDYLVAFAGVIAFSPMFIFWGRMARPYAAICFFLVLGWRWWGFYIPAMLMNPFAIVGINLLKIKQRWLAYLVLIGLSIAMYKIQPISGHFRWEFLSHAKRLWIIPLFSLGLHICYWDIQLQRLCPVCFKLARKAFSGLRNEQELQ